VHWLIEAANTTVTRQNRRAGVTPIITAVIGGIVVLSGAFVARNATRYAAELQAAQRRRDSELAELKEFGDGVTSRVDATGKYMFALKQMKLPTDNVSFEQFVSGLSEPQRQRRISHLLEIQDKREQWRRWP
jgi:hypothetical protein